MLKLYRILHQMSKMSLFYKVWENCCLFLGLVKLKFIRDVSYKSYLYLIESCIMKSFLFVDDAEVKV